MTTIAMYTRLSKDPDGHQTSTARKDAHCRAYAEMRGWAVEAYEDVYVSAYRPGVRRPAFESMLLDAAARPFDGILVWKLDRLVRRPSDFERLWNAIEPAGLFVASVMEPIDSATPLGLALLRILVALAGLESATTGVRIRAQKREVAEQGRPPAAKAYGMTLAWDAVVEEEAAVIREAAKRVVAGERLAAVARDFRNRGVQSAGGKHWSDATLGRILRSPRLVGDRAHRGEVVARNCWPAILDRQTWARLQLVLNHPARRGAPRRHTPRLATGLAACGLWRPTHGDHDALGRALLQLPDRAHRLRAVHVMAAPLEEWLLDRLLERLRAEHGVAPPPAERDDAAEVAGALRELAVDYYSARTVTKPEFLAARAALVRRAEELSRPPAHAYDVAKVLGCADPRRALAGLEPRRLQALLDERLERVVVSRFVTARRPVFDAGRLSRQWR